MQTTTTFDDRLARSVTTLCGAKECLLDFIREGCIEHSRHHVAERSHGFDLYLPWFMEVIEFREPYRDRETLSIPELQRLYMDAAWSLVMQGILRPGPRFVGEEVDKNTYGKAFSLTQATIL